MNQEFSASIPFSWKVSMFSICKCSGDKSKWGAAAAATTPTRGRSESKCREISLKFASHSTPSSQPVACMHVWGRWVMRPKKEWLGRVRDGDGRLVFCCHYCCSICLIVRSIRKLRESERERQRTKNSWK